MEITEIQLVRSLCKESFVDFCKIFWHTVVAEELIWNWHMDVICDVYQKAAERIFAGKPKEHDIVVNVAPGSSKSTITSVLFPAWCWTRMPSFRFLGASYAHNLAMDLSRKTRDVVTSDEYRACFPEIVLREDQSAKTYFVNSKKGARYSVGSLGMITGMHFHWIGIDDPIDPRNVLSEVVLDQTNTWINNTLPSRKVDRRIAVTSLIMQRLHQNDPTAQALTKKRVKHICIPAELRDNVNPPELRKFYKNKLMDPVRINQEVLDEAFEELKEYGYAGQYLQNPVPESGGMFNTEKLNYGHPVDLVEVWRSWDKAGTPGKSNRRANKGRGAYTVGVKIGKDSAGRVFVLDVIRVRLSSFDREKLIYDTAEYEDGRKVKICIEQEPGSGGKESAEGTVRRLLGFHVTVDRPQGDKETRADPFSVQVNAGNVWIVPGSWNKEFVEEMKFFPFSTTKDQIDAASAGFAKLSIHKRRIGGMKKRHEIIKLPVPDRRVLEMHDTEDKKKQRRPRGLKVIGKPRK